MSTDTDTVPRPVVWWFTRGALSIFTIPVFLILLAGTLGAFYQGGIQTLAYIKVTKAVWGWLGVAACLFIWPFSLFMPGVLWWSAIKATPGIYAKEAAATSRGVGVRQAVVTVILLVAFSTFMQWGHGKIIGWIADRDPDAAYRAGVTGSRPPSGFQMDTETTRHPTTEAPELAPYFTGDRFYYIGEFYQNYAYLMKLEEGTYLDRLSDGRCAADVHTAREAAAVVFFNPKATAFAAVDLSDPALKDMKLERMEFEVASPDSLVAKAWARASNPDAYKQDHKQGKRARWVYVDTHADQRSVERYYAETAIHTEPKTGYKFFELLTVTEERYYFTIDGSARTFSADLTDVLGTPVGERKQRDITDGDIASAIWRLHETGVIR